MVTHGTLTSDERQRLRDFVRVFTAAGGARLLSMHRLTLTRAIAGRPLRRSTLECVRHRLAVLAEEERADDQPVTAAEHLGPEHDR